MAEMARRCPTQVARGARIQGHAAPELPGGAACHRGGDRRTGIGIFSDVLVAPELAAGTLVKAFDLSLPGYGFYLVRGAVIRARKPCKPSRHGCGPLLADSLLPRAPQVACPQDSK